ncbi:MAG TPA: hypothetical protein VGK84_02105 [Candidatus Tumulicola sp.]
MNRSVTVFLLPVFFIGATAVAAAQQSMAPSPQASPLVHHAVSSNSAAQAAFDRGLLDYYAYNPEAAEHEFYTAADLDPKMAMAYWGIALSNAPNLNVPATDDRDNQAREAISAAKDMEANATPEDRMLIDAAYARFASKTKLAPSALQVAYRDALARVEKAYPDDPDVAALHAEAALYVAAGDRPGDIDTWAAPKIAAYVGSFAALLPMFQADLAKFPNNPGLLHFYIHTAQFAKDSKVAVPAAIKLASFTLPPEDSHLTHMPGHTFFDVGMYNEGLDVGTRSVAMDYAAFDCCHPGYYSAPRYYHSHNVEFLIYAMIQTGHAADAVAVARRAGDPWLIERTLVAAQDWKAILELPYSKGNDTAATFARALAYAKLGQNDKATATLADLPIAPASKPARAAFGSAMRSVVGAQIALNEHDDAKALSLLEGSSADAARGDRLNGYSEMPTLYYYSPHLALAELAIKMNKADVARSALKSELLASPKSPAATQALATLNAKS